MSTPAVTNEVADRFHGLRRKYLVSRISIAVLVAIGALLFGWVGLSFGDYFAEWSLTTRKAALSVVVAACSVWLLSRVVIVFRDSRQRDFAGLLERTFDGFGQRIRTVLDTVSGKVSGPEEMLSALGHQTLGRWETLTPSQLIPRKGIATAALLCAAGGIAAAGMFLRGGDARLSMNRALGMDLQYTKMNVDPGNHRLLEGTPVKVSLELTGRTNRDVTLRYRHLPLPEVKAAETEKGEIVVESEWTESDLKKAAADASDDRGAVFNAGLGKALNPIEYQFVTSIGSTDVYRIDVQPMIEAERIETSVEPPEYTRLERRSFSSRDITVLEQSRVTVSVKTNHPLNQAILEIGPKPSKLKSVEIQPGDDPSQWVFELASTDSLHWKFSGFGRDETPMTPVKGRLRIRRDGAPKITWRDPTDEIKVHTLAEVPMSVQMGDDYGLTEAGIVFQLGDDEDFVLAEWFAEDDPDSINTTRMKLEEILPLESFALTERDFISYYAYAIDNRGFGPQRHESDMRYIDIRPLRQLYREIELMPGNNNNGQRNLRVGLGELIARQRFLINRTRRLVRSSSAGIAAKVGTIDRMVESQSELAGLVRFLAEFLVSQGNDDVEALNQAETLMLQASDSLAAGSFDLALIQENDAQLALAEARRTLDIILVKRLTPQQRRALSNFNRRLRQKLRRERPKTERQIVDSLNRIASQQQRLGQMATSLAAAMATEGAGGGDNQVDSSERPASEDEPEMNDESKEGEEPDEPTVEERQEDVYQQQIDLLERLQGIEEELTERLSESELMAERLQRSKDEMDGLATKARDRDYEDYDKESSAVVDQLREMSLQLDALQNPEAVGRVSSIRDMTGSLVNMEHELSRRANPKRDTTSDRAEDLRLMNQLSERTKTIEAILSAPVDIGDVETSEVNDELQNFAQETDFLNQLETSRVVTEELSMDDVELRDPEHRNASEAMERALQYAEAAQILDELYQELVTPRLASLRRIESQASRLNARLGGGSGGQSGGSGGSANNPTQQSGGNGQQHEPQENDEDMEAQAGGSQLDVPQSPLNGGGQKQNESEEDDEKKSGGKENDDEEVSEAELRSSIAMLIEQLRQNGMKDLAELLDEAEKTDEEIREMLRSGGQTGSRSGNFSTANSDPRGTRLALLVKKLRERIREAILLEISADRDAAVPVEYENAVDGYLRSIAGERE